MKNETTMQLEGDRNIVISRTFNAAPRIVFDAWTKPEHLKRWWAPRSHGVTLAACTAEIRAGGTYRYVLRRGDDEMAFSGRYTEVTSPTRLVYTQVFEPMRDAGEAVITVSFDEQANGKTRLVSIETYPSKDVREAVIASGMETGMRETMDQLDALVASLG